MPSHNELYQRAVDAIQAVFEDVSVPISEVIQDMIRLKDDIDIKLSERCYTSTLKNEEEKKG